MFAVFALSVMFRQSSANGDGDGENDRKEGFHGTKVFVAVRSRAFTRGDGLPARSLRLIPSRDDRHRHPIKHHIGLVVSKFSSPLIFASYTPDGIRNALPIIPLTFRNRRV